MWILENEDYNKGGPIQWDEPLHFRHLSIGIYNIY